MPDQPALNSQQTITRRDLLSARINSETDNNRFSPPVAQDTIRLSTYAMACEFTVMLNPIPHDQIWLASEALEAVHDLENQYTVYRDSSELMELNRSAGINPCCVEPNLFHLLKLSIEIAHKSGGTYNPLMHPLIKLWSAARLNKTVPTLEEIQKAIHLSRLDDVHFDEANFQIMLSKPNMSFNLGSIGKGHAIDILAQKLLAAGIHDFLIHAGQSSVYAAGYHGSYQGWPIGISHPNLSHRYLGTILLYNQGMSTSGSGVQFYRVDGKKYGHILDPRTGMPADSTLSAMTFHSTAAMADALSTAAYVSGQDQINSLMQAFPDCGYIMLAPGKSAHEFEVHSGGMLPENIIWN